MNGRIGTDPEGHPLFNGDRGMQYGNGLPYTGFVVPNDPAVRIPVPQGSPDEVRWRKQRAEWVPGQEFDEEPHG